MPLSFSWIPRIILVVGILIFTKDNIFAGTAGNGDFPKPLGVWSLDVHDTIEVFKGHSIRECPANPKISPASQENPPAIPPGGDDGICWRCTPTRLDGQCHNPGDKKRDPSCEENCETDPVCNDPQGYHTHYGRECELKYPPYNYILDDDVFKPGSFGHAKNLECTKDPIVPDKGLIVSKDASKTYMWDDAAPICMRGGFSAYASFGSGWINDDVIRERLKTGSGLLDTTLTYDFTDADNNPSTPIEVYTGIWTNRNVQAKGICSDAESGCNSAFSAPIFSGPLRNLQRIFVPINKFVDNTNNDRDHTVPQLPGLPRDVCQSNTSRLTGLSRVCRFQIIPRNIIQTIKDNKEWFDNIISPEDNAFLSGVTLNPPKPNTAAFSNAIVRLRGLSMSGSKSLSTFLDLTEPRHDLLYTMLTGSCMYNMRFAPGAIYPLIDKIKPTIEISAQIGSGLTEPETLLEQEGTNIAGEPKLFTTGAYLAGSGIINITLVDSGSSTFTDNNIWNRYDGISGIRSYTISICRTKTHTGMILDDDCSVSSGHSPSHQIYFSGATFDQYNATGAIDIPHTITTHIDLSDTENSDGIQIAGEYQVYIMMIDRAGNSNISSAVFDIVPEGFDPSRTRLDKYDDRILETPSHTIYTISGTTAMIPGTGTGVAYANAIDIQTYKLSFFDIYGNPIYGWKLYDFGLTKTGVYLEQVDRTGPSALFINSRGNTLSNTFHDRVTDGDGALRFTMLSYTPGEFLEQYKFSYKNWDRHRMEVGSKKPYTFPENTTPPLSQTGSFFHIFTGALNLYTTNRIDLGTNNDIRMEFYTTSPTQNQTLTGFLVGNFLESIKSMSPDNFTITNTGRIISSTSHSYDPLIPFDSYYPDPEFLFGTLGTFIPEQKGSLFVASLKVAAYPYLTLSFSGQTTRYYVSDRQAVFGSGIIYDTGSLNRIYVEGNKRSTGKEGYVDTLDSLGTINSADLRNRVRKNVALLLRNRDENSKEKIIGRLKYVVDNKRLSDLMVLSDRNDWDTLVVQGGNLIIDQDFNTGTTLQNIAHKGIILLKDEKSGSGGSIYITPNVTFIGGVLFAEESILSARPDGKPYEFSNSARALALSRQIVFYGGIYSKNTIGGAVRADSNGQYILPWKGKTDSLDEAVMYDLAFLRMDNKLKNSDFNKGRTEYVVVLTDTRNITDPLPGWK